MWCLLASFEVGGQSLSGLDEFLSVDDVVPINRNGLACWSPAITLGLHITARLEEDSRREQLEKEHERYAGRVGCHFVRPEIVPLLIA